MATVPLPMWAAVGVSGGSQWVGAMIRMEEKKAGSEPGLPALGAALGGEQG